MRLQSRPAGSDRSLSSLISCSLSSSTCCRMAWYSLSLSSSCSSSLESNKSDKGNTTGRFIFIVLRESDEYLIQWIHKHTTESFLTAKWEKRSRKYSRLPVGLQLHPAQLHAHRPLCIMGLVWDGGAERADSWGGHGVVVSGHRRRPALVGWVSLCLCVIVHVVLLGWVAFWGQTEVRPQLWSRHKTQKHRFKWLLLL